jgi:hypothetical protein
MSVGLQSIGKWLTNTREWIGKKVKPLTDTLSSIPGVKEAYENTIKQYYDVLRDRYGMFEDIFKEGDIAKFSDFSKGGSAFFTSKTINSIIDKLRGKGVSKKKLLTISKMMQIYGN